MEQERSSIYVKNGLYVYEQWVSTTVNYYRAVRHWNTHAYVMGIYNENIEMDTPKPDTVVVYNSGQTQQCPLIFYLLDKDEVEYCKWKKQSYLDMVLKVNDIHDDRWRWSWGDVDVNAKV